MGRNFLSDLRNLGILQSFNGQSGLLLRSWNNSQHFRCDWSLAGRHECDLSSFNVGLKPNMVDDSVIHSDDGILLGVLLDDSLHSANFLVVDGGDKLGGKGIDLGKLFSSCDSLGVGCEDCCLPVLVDLLDGLGGLDHLSDLGVIDHLRL